MSLQEGRRVSLEDLQADLDSLLDYIGLQLDELTTNNVPSRDLQRRNREGPPSIDGSTKSSLVNESEDDKVASVTEDDETQDEVDVPTLVPFDRIDMVQVEAFLSLYLQYSPPANPVDHHTARSHLPTSTTSFGSDPNNISSTSAPFTSSSSLPIVSHQSLDELDSYEQLLVAPRLTLPARVSSCLRFLRQERALRSEGLFRKCGLKARVQELHRILPREPPETTCVHDAADWLKAWFRARAPLLSPRLVSALAHAAHYQEAQNGIGGQVNLDSQAENHWRALLLAYEQRLCLQQLLLFLNEVANHADANGMSASNLAICWTPSLLVLPTSTQPNGRNAISSSALLGSNGPADASGWRPLLDQARCVLEQLIDRAPALFCLPVGERINHKASGLSLENHHEQLLENASTIDFWKRESQLRATGLSVPVVQAKTFINASPQDILLRILYQRHVWDPLVSEWRVLKALSDQEDILLLKLFSNDDDDNGEAWTVVRKWRQVMNSADLLPRMSFHRSNSSLNRIPGLLLEESRVPSSFSTSSLAYGAEQITDHNSTTGVYTAEWRITESPVATSPERPSVSTLNKTLLQLKMSIDLNGRALAFYSHTWPRHVQSMLRALAASFEVAVDADKPQIVV